MTTVLFDLCGGKPRQQLYEQTRQEHKALIEVEQNRPMFVYSLEQLLQCTQIDRIYLAGPSEIAEKMPRDDCILFVESGKNMSGTVRNCWSAIRKEYGKTIREGNMKIVFFFGVDTVFIDSKTIDDFVHQACMQHRDLIFQVLKKQGKGYVGSKIPRYTNLKDIQKEFTITNLFQLNLRDEKKVDSVEQLLFRRDLDNATDEYYENMGKGPKSFFVSAYKIASRKLGWFAAGVMLAQSVVRYKMNRLDESYLRNVSRLLIGLDLGYVETNNLFAAYDIDNADDLNFARKYILQRKSL